MQKVKPSVKVIEPPAEVESVMLKKTSTPTPQVLLESHFAYEGEVKNVDSATNLQVDYNPPPRIVYTQPSTEEEKADDKIETFQDALEGIVIETLVF